VTGQKVTPIGVTAIGFRVLSFLLLLSMAVNFCTLSTKIHFISATRNAWVGDLVCLCVMEDRSCAEQWMVEGVTPLKKVCGIDGWR
jgi:hypothetical protein